MLAMKTKSIQAINAPGKLREIFVIRHGESQGQLDPDLYARLGDDNIPLTGLGERQSEKTGRVLKILSDQANIQFSRIDHSTSLRAKQTAARIYDYIGPETANGVRPDCRLDKQRFGEFDGLFSNAARQEKCPIAFENYQRELEELGPLGARPPGGESILDVIERVSDYLQEAARDSKPRLVVTHGLPALIVEKQLLGLSDEWLQAKMDTVENATVRHIHQSEMDNGYVAGDLEAEPLDIHP